MKEDGIRVTGWYVSGMEANGAVKRNTIVGTGQATDKACFTVSTI